MSAVQEMFALTPKQLTKAVKRCLLKGIVPSIKGSPGIGKSDVIRAVAKELNLFVIDIRLSQASPEDLNGFPAIVNGVAKFLPFEHFPRADNQIPEGYSGWLIFFDEITSAPKSVQAASYKIILDRYIGNYPLHDSCAIVAAGNLASDKAVVVQQSTALTSRMAQMSMKSNTPDWLEWASMNQLDNRGLAYLQFMPNHLHVFDPNKTDENFACPRTWAMTLNYISDLETPDIVDNAVIAGLLGSGIAAEFVAFMELFRDLVPIEDILKDPKGVSIPHRHDKMYAAIGYLYPHINADTFENLMDYVKRFPEELQSVFMKTVTHYIPEMRKHPVYVKNTVKLLRYIGEDDEEFTPTD